jgi:hypothetical protein
MAAAAAAGPKPRRFPKMFVLVFADDAEVERKIEAGVCRYHAAWQAMCGLPELGPLQRETQWHVDAARRSLVVWSAAERHQGRQLVEQNLCRFFSDPLLVPEPADRLACAEVFEPYSLQPTATAAAVPRRVFFPQNWSWRNVAVGDAVKRRWLEVAREAQDRRAAAAQAEPPRAADAPAPDPDPDPASPLLELTPNNDVAGAAVERAALRLSAPRKRKKMGADEPAPAPPGAPLYSTDAVLRHLHGAVMAANQREGREGKRNRVQIFVAPIPAFRGGVVPSAQIVEVVVTPRESPQAARLRRLAALVAVHAGPCDALGADKAAALFALLLQAPADAALHDWPRLLLAARSDALLRKQVRLFRGLDERAAGRSQSAACAQLAADPAAAAAHAAYARWYAGNGAGPPLPWGELPGVVVCDAYVHHAQTTAAVLAEYQAAVQQTWPERLPADPRHSFVLLSAAVRFQAGAGLLQAVHDAFLETKNAADAPRVATVQEALLTRAGPRRCKAWEARHWIVLTAGVPAWQIARLVQALHQHQQAAAPGEGPRDVIFTDCSATGAFAGRDGGWDVFGELREAHGAARYRSAPRHRLGAPDLARLTAAAAFGDERRWSAEGGAEGGRLRRGDLVLATGVYQQSCTSAKHDRVQARVEAVARETRREDGSWWQQVRLRHKAGGAASGGATLLNDEAASAAGSPLFAYDTRAKADGQLVRAHGDCPRRSASIGTASAQDTAALSHAAAPTAELLQAAAAALQHTCGAVAVAPRTLARIMAAAASAPC